MSIIICCVRRIYLHCYLHKILSIYQSANCVRRIYSHCYLHKILSIYQSANCVRRICE